MNCNDVVNLAGDRQAVMLLRIDHQQNAQQKEQQVVYHGDPNTHKVSLLGFRSLTP